MDPSQIHTDLAVLSAKFEAAQVENSNKLDAIRTLLTEKLTHVEDKVEHNRNNSDQKFVAHDRLIADLRTDVTNLQTAHARFDGKTATIFGVMATVISVVVAIAVKLIMQ